MSDQALPRPGVVSGRYPQRADERLGTLDRIMAAGIGRLRQFFLGWINIDHGFIARVHREEAAIADLSDVELVAKRIEISQALRTEGLVDTLVARAFALIRVTSDRTIEMRHFDVQLIGGRIMLRGQIAEMETGTAGTAVKFYSSKRRQEAGKLYEQLTAERLPHPCP